MDAAMLEELNGFIESWTQDDNGTKTCFLTLKSHLEAMDQITLTLVARPGVSYSLRAAHPDQTKRTLFAMVDVIDDDPADRWLSCCFYKDMVNDPDELADEVPEGLLGEDARCFDMYEKDDELTEYIKARLSDAATAAAG